MQVYLCICGFFPIGNTTILYHSRLAEFVDAVEPRVQRTDYKSYEDLWLHGGLVPLTHVLFKSQL